MSNDPKPAVAGPAAPKSGFLTSEFWLTVAWAVGMGLLSLHVIPASDVDEVQALVVGLGEALTAFLAGLAPVWRYITKRNDLKKAFADGSEAPASEPEADFKV